MHYDNCNCPPCRSAQAAKLKADLIGFEADDLESWETGDGHKLGGPTSPSSIQQPGGRLGTLTVTGGRRPFRYRFLPDDAVWLARLIVGEAGGRDDADNRAVIWALFNRYGLFTHRVFPSFRSFIRAYSTVLQPVLKSVGAAARHYQRPGFVRTGGYYPRLYRGQRIPKGQIQRHLDLQARPWSELPVPARHLARAALEGQVPNPVGTASEFASTWIYFRQANGRDPSPDEWRAYTMAFALRKGWVWIGETPGLDQKKNVFFIDGRARNLPLNAVRVIPPGAGGAQPAFELGDEREGDFESVLAGEMGAGGTGRWVKQGDKVIIYGARVAANRNLFSLSGSRDAAVRVPTFVEWEEPGCEGEEPSLELEADYFDSEVWTAAAGQIAFRDRVLTAHLARSSAAKGPPQRDLRISELRSVPGTDIETLPDTAAAAGRLLAAANADLAKAQQAGDADALRTIGLTVNSGYRGQEHQRRRWVELFPKYYKQSRAARERLPGGPHSAAAIDYMLKPEKNGGFGLMGRIAAPGYSNHQGGIAVDFRQVRHVPHKIANSTDKKVRASWRASWFHRWLKANAATYGFVPLATEEWHWEYRPRAARSGSVPSAASKPTVSDHLGGKLWTFQAKTLHTRATIFCPKAALGKDEVQVLLFAHGLMTVCQPGATNAAGLVDRAPFRFGAIVDRSGRPMVLVVPDLNWNKSVRWHILAKPSNLNAFIGEVLGELGRVQSRARISLSTLIIAGHSRAYGFLEPLAQSREDPEMTRGALAKLSQVWAFDTTYTGNVDLWIDWLRRNTRLQVTVFYRPGTGTQVIGDRFYGQRRPRLIVTQAAEGHCQVPAKRLPGLLKLSAPEHRETDCEQSAVDDQTLDEGDIDQFEQLLEQENLDDRFPEGEGSIGEASQI